jgi:hypothetical protein
MHRFALIPADAACVGDRLDQGIRRRVGRARRLAQPALTRPHGIPCLYWSL